MRWKNPKYGDVRTVERFLFLPLTLNGETRWLEKAKIEQKYFVSGFWWDVNWAD